jgi:tripartite-type tricarboxylate transporter receptor subunit TctC
MRPESPQSDFERCSTQTLEDGAPKNTHGEIIEKLNKEINAGLADPKMKAQLSDLGGTPFAGSPGDFKKFIADETETWGKVIRAANLKAD